MHSTIIEQNYSSARVWRKHTQHYIRSILGFFHYNVIDSTMYSILPRLLLVVALIMCLTLLPLGTLVGEVPKVTTAEA